MESARKDDGHPTAVDGPRWRSYIREVIGAVAQYGLLAGFAAVAAGISAQGLTEFARASMGLRGPWPYLLFAALDGAAAMCAVVLMRRAARGESALAPRLAVWGLVAASSTFNWTHAPARPGAREAFALMPVIAATLFEFALRETQRTARTVQRMPNGWGWLHPAERIRVLVRFAASDRMSAEAATRRVRVEHAAQRLYALRNTLRAHEQEGASGARYTRRARRAERRAHAALTRAGFADPDTAADVLRQVQVLALTPALAMLDYATARDARAALANLITPGSVPIPLPDHDSGPDRPLERVGGFRGGVSPVWAHAPVPGFNGQSAPGPNGQSASDASDSARHDGHLVPRPVSEPRLVASAGQSEPNPGQTRDRELIEAARRIVADARQEGVRLSQTALARRLRAQGHRIANDRLRWLSALAGLEPRQRRASGGP